MFSRYPSLFEYLDKVVGGINLNLTLNVSCDSLNSYNCDPSHHSGTDDPWRGGRGIM